MATTPAKVLSMNVGPRASSTTGAPRGEDLQYCATFGTSTLVDAKKDRSNGRTYKAFDALAPVSCP